jgi:hypothetical protein
MDIHKITIQLARPRGNFHGRVEYGFYTAADGVVTLVGENGVDISSSARFRRAAMLGMLPVDYCGNDIPAKLAISIGRSPTHP